MARVLVFALALTACACKPTSGTESGPSPTPSGATASTKTANRCDQIRVALKAELAKLPSPCSTDGDCTCYVGGVSGVTGCGGISDLAAAKRIGELTRQHESAKCDDRVDCAARLCQAACVDGHCGPRRPKLH